MRKGVCTVSVLRGATAIFGRDGLQNDTRITDAPRSHAKSLDGISGRESSGWIWRPRSETWFGTSQPIGIQFLRAPGLVFVECLVGERSELVLRVLEGLFPAAFGSELVQNERRKVILLCGRTF